MRDVFRILAVCAALFGAASVGFADGPTPEKAQGTAALDGSIYAQIAPTFNGSDGNESYIRLGNGGSTTTTYTITVVGTPSGNIYGTAAIVIPPGASIQYALTANGGSPNIITLANAANLAGGDTGYSLYLQDPDSTLSYQHVIYNGANGFFENMSVCKYAAGANYTGLNSKLLNVHTTQLAGYPVYISVHNYAATAVTYNAAVSDAATGLSIGNVQVAVGANATVTQPFSWYQQQLGWSPTSSQPHANMVFTAVSPATYEADVSQYVFNQQFTAYVNMTSRCGISTPAATAEYEGTVVTATQASGGLTINTQGSNATATLVFTGGNSIAMTGTYTGGTINFTGGGYTFTGSVASGVYTGTFSGTNSGSVTAVAGAQTSVTGYCGTNTKVNGGTVGLFDIEITSAGVISGETDSGLTFSAQLTGTTISGTSSNSGTITGTLQNGTASGSFTGGNGGTHTFTATACSFPS